MNVRPVHPDDLVTEWPRIAPFAAQMSARFAEDWPLAEISRQAIAKDLLLWLILDDKDEPVGVVGTKVLAKHSGRRVLEISLCAGHDHRHWVNMISVLEDHGRKFGADEIVIRGRSGWLPSLPGFRMAKEITLIKDIRNADEHKITPNGRPIEGVGGVRPHDRDIHVVS